MPYPPMRQVDAAQFQHDGQDMILLTDPEGLMEEQVAVSLAFFLVLSLLDGQEDAAAIQRDLAEATGGARITAEQIDQVLTEADRLYLLENTRSAQRRAELERAWDEQPARPAAHAGSAYPADPAECRAFFGDLFAGLPLGPATNGLARAPRGLVAPHIDYRVGGRTIAQAYAALDPARPAPLYIVLGVAHHPAKNLFTLTDKDFETPLGLVATDKAAAARLAELYGAGRLDGALAHQREHSVEFAAIALRHIHGEAPFTILPLLCGALTDELDPAGPSPASHAEVGELIEALRTLIAERGGEVCIVASVDLSHVGLKFGEMEGVDDERAAAIAAADGAMLDLIEARDAEAFFNHFRADGNARNVDAVTAVYLMLKTLGTDGGTRCLAYDQWREEATDSMVTYASVAIE